MGEIMSVLGPINSEDLGFTDMHAHILWDGSVYRKRLGIWEMPSDLEDIPVTMENLGTLRRNPMFSQDNLSMKDEEIMVGEIAEFKKSGGSALLNVDPPGLRYDITAIKRISEKTGVHIIAPTGLYLEDSWPRKYQNMTIDEYQNYMTKEIETGIEDTGIKAGHIKIAITDLSKQQEKALRAAARTANKTGLSLTVHPGFGIGNDGRRIVKILLEEDMNLKKAIIAHAQHFLVESSLRKLVLEPDSWKLKLDYCWELLDTGVNLAIDTFGHMWSIERIGFERPTDWQRLAGVVAILKAGYSSQLVIGSDTYIKILLKSFGGEGSCRLTKSIVPILKWLEVSDYDIRKMTVENPARILARE